MKALNNRIEIKKQRAVNLLNEIIDLEYSLKLKRFNRFSEEVRNIGSKKEPNEVKIKIGYYFDWFMDDDYPNDKSHAVKIERSEIIEVNGEKSNRLSKITYYTINDF